MKKKILLLALSVFSMGLFSQQVENPGFEFWEDAGTVWDEPVDWSSIKTSDAGEIINSAAPAVWEKSTDHHSGEFSVELTNLAVLDIVAAGTLTNGRVHADFDPDLGYVYTDTLNLQWNTPCTVRPDSLTGWYKFYPQGQDFGSIQALLHIGYSQLPEFNDSSNWVGYARFDMQPGATVSSWTRFSIPFHYYDSRTPQYLLFVMTSGNGTTPVANSYARYDDIALVGGESAIGDNDQPEFLIYADNNRLVLKNLPTMFLPKATATLFNMNGQAVWKGEVISNEVLLNTGKKLNGLYIFSISSGKEIVNRKFFIPQ